MEVNANYETREVIYVGRRFSQNEKTCIALITPQLLANATKEKSFSTEMVEQSCSLFAYGKKSNFAVIGGHYEVECQLDEQGRILRVKAATAIFKSGPKDQTFYANWSAADDYVVQKKRIKAAENKAKAHNDLLDAVEVLRKQYQRVQPGYRRGFQLWLLQQLEKH